MNETTEFALEGVAGGLLWSGLSYRLRLKWFLAIPATALSAAVLWSTWASHPTHDAAAGWVIGLVFGAAAAYGWARVRQFDQRVKHNRTLAGLGEMLQGQPVPGGKLQGYVITQAQPDQGTYRTLYTQSWAEFDVTLSSGHQGRVLATTDGLGVTFEGNATP